MCNAYTVRPIIGQQELEGIISQEVEKLPSSLVRRLGRGVVVKQAGERLVPQIMRWGFSHEKYKSVNNARSESLGRGMWIEPMAERRCLVPISHFYEWQELIGNAKRAYEIKVPGQEWLWVAGLYGVDESGGPCYATITTEPTKEFSEIHDRLLAIVGFDEGLSFLRGEKSTFEPYGGPLAVVPCDSPLKTKKPGPSQASQGELF